MMNSTEKSLPEKLSDDIIAYILEEQLQPNDKLPNESVLSEKMGAGRSSIRERLSSKRLICLPLKRRWLSWLQRKRLSCVGILQKAML